MDPRYTFLTLYRPFEFSVKRLGGPFNILKWFPKIIVVFLTGLDWLQSLKQFHAQIQEFSSGGGGGSRSGQIDKKSYDNVFFLFFF